MSQEHQEPYLTNVGTIMHPLLTGWLAKGSNGARNDASNLCNDQT